MSAAEQRPRPDLSALRIEREPERVNFISTGTVNWQTFSEVAFNFDVDSGVALMGICLAVFSGVLGGLIPAATAARMPITQALREI